MIIIRILAIWFFPVRSLLESSIWPKLIVFIAPLLYCSLIRRRHVVVCQYLMFENNMAVLNIYVEHTV